MREDVPAAGREILESLRTPLGRLQLKLRLFRRARPVLFRIARLYRQTFVSTVRVAVVVGSFGKTTTARTVMCALGGDPSRLSERNAGSFLARAMLLTRPWHRYSVMEVGVDRPGQMHRNAVMIRPDIAVVTSIGSEHHRSFGTLEVTRHEKAEMARALPDSGLAVLNGDDPNVLWMKSQTTARILTFGFDDANDVHAKDVSHTWPQGMRFTLCAAGRSYPMSTRLVGRHMVYCILAAAATALGEDIDLEDVIPVLESLEPTPGRMQMVPLDGGALLLRDDYKSSLETIEASLEALSEIPAENRIVVLGEVSEPPGSQGPIYKRVGHLAAQAASRVILVTEKKAFERYRSGLYSGGMSRESIHYAGRSAMRAAETLRQSLEPGDVVLIKGKDTQRLERVAFALMGREVRCDLTYCNLKATRCATCDLLESGPLA